MHVGFISTLRGAAWGGSEELWVGAAHAALRRGMRVSVWFPQPPGPHPKWDALAAAGAEFAGDDPFAGRALGRAARLSGRAGRYARKRLAGGNPLAALAGAAAERLGAAAERAGGDFETRASSLRRFLAGRPDVVLVNEGGSIPRADVVDALLGAAPAIPYVLLCHSHFAGVPEQRARERAGVLFRAAREVLFVSAATHRAVERQLAVPLPYARIVRNPVNLTRHDPVPWPHGGTTAFASLGQFRTEWKGQDLLLAAFGAARWRGREWRLSLFGAGDEAAYLRELAAMYGIADRVTVAGYVDDIRAVWRTHHALVLPSRVESAPLVVVEAMLCGRPSIVTDVGGVSEWVSEPRTAFVAPAPTVEAIDAALERAWQHRPAWERMGIDAHDDALLRFDPAAAQTLLATLLGEAVPATALPARTPTGAST